MSEILVCGVIKASRQGLFPILPPLTLFFHPRPAKIHVLATYATPLINTTRYH